MSLAKDTCWVCSACSEPVKAYENHYCWANGVPEYEDPSDMVPELDLSDVPVPESLHHPDKEVSLLVQHNNLLKRYVDLQDQTIGAMRGVVALQEQRKRLCDHLNTKGACPYTMTIINQRPEGCQDGNDGAQCCRCWDEVTRR